MKPTEVYEFLESIKEFFPVILYENSGWAISLWKEEKKKREYFKGGTLIAALLEAEKSLWIHCACKFDREGNIVEVCEFHKKTMKKSRKKK